jgi:NAD(P)H-hydrate repair Nnr-like enzyme with NAD(P)H-hydrate dehydratase domain
MKKVIRRSRSAMNKRSSDFHRGQDRLVLVTVGNTVGSNDYVGAPVLAGLASSRAGYGIVKRTVSKVE